MDVKAEKFSVSFLGSNVVQGHILIDQAKVSVSVSLTSWPVPENCSFSFSWGLPTFSSPLTALTSRGLL